MSMLWDPIFGAERVAAEIDDRAWVRAMLRAEAALARAAASAGVVDEAAAEAVANACADAGWVAIESLGAEAAAGGNPVIPLVQRLRARVRPAGENAVHVGATSQDIVDTAAMLICRRAVGVIVDDLSGAADAAARLAREHRDTPMAARTLLQQAGPTTFGAVAAGWGTGLDRAVARLGAVEFAAQLGGAAGTLAALHPDGPSVRRAFARELDLTDPEGVWHTERTRVAELAGVLATAAGVAGKVATDVVLLAQTEVGEVHEAAPAAVTTRAAAAQAPGLAATLYSAMSGEQQRPAGAWHAEWPAFMALLRWTGGAAARLRQCLSGLYVDAGAMHENLSRTSGVLLADRIAAHLAPAMGRAAAQQTVRDAARKGKLDTLDIDPDLLDQLTYLGHAGDIVDAYLRSRPR
jgi:3-carboxy-cis,cis-muconate cycloisomerase